MHLLHASVVGFVKCAGCKYVSKRFVIISPPSPFLYSLHSGTLVNSIGFEWMLVGIAILCFCYAPLLTLLRAPPTKEEKKVGGNGGEVAFVANAAAAPPTTASIEAGVDNPAIVSDELSPLPLPSTVGGQANSITKF